MFLNKYIKYFLNYFMTFKFSSVKIYFNEAFHCFTIHCVTICNMQYAICNMQYAICNVQCAMCNVKCMYLHVFKKCGSHKIYTDIFVE